MKIYRQWREFFRHSNPNIDLKPLRNWGLALLLVGIFLYSWNHSVSEQSSIWILIGATLIGFTFFIPRSSSLKISFLLILAFHVTLLNIRTSLILDAQVLILVILDFGFLFRLHLLSWNRDILLQSLLSALRSALLTLPFLLFLIILFQSVYRRGAGHPTESALSGISHHLQPGLISKLTLKSQLAFQIKTHPALAPTQPYYWRVATLTKSQDLEWSHPLFTRPSGSIPENEKNSCPAECSLPCKVEQTIYPWDDNELEIVALDVPFPPARKTVITGIANSPQFASSSLCPIRVAPLTEKEQSIYLKAESSLDPADLIAIQNLVLKFKKSANRPLDLVKQVLSHFKTEGFVYALESTPTQTPVNLAQFLFKRREGFCEHYAAAFSSVMRMLGVPSRVVVGFLGGTYNPYGDFWRLDLSQAHSWSEVWVEDRWIRIDPSAVIRSKKKLPPAQPSSIAELYWEALKFWTRDWLESSSLSHTFFWALSGALGIIFLRLSLRKLIHFVEGRTETAQFDKAFALLLKTLSKNAGARRPNQGFNEYFIQVLRYLDFDPKSQNLRRDLREVFEFYQTVRFGPGECELETLRKWRKRIKPLIDALTS
jgi:hypothetical protein